MAQFSRKFLEKVINRDSEADIIEDSIIDHLRWEVVHLLVFKYRCRYYKVEYLRPATELQDIQSFRGKEIMIDVMEVKPVMIRTRHWISVNLDPSAELVASND